MKLIFWKPSCEKTNYIKIKKYTVMKNIIDNVNMIKDFYDFI